MKLVMTLLARDEEDIIRENIEFHLNLGVDEIVLMDNQSADSTADIAAEYVRAGVLHYIFQAEDDYSQSRWVTHMARYAAKELEADWIINNDADEFWWPVGGTLKHVFRQLDPATMAASAERTNFLPRPMREGTFWERMDVRHKVSLNSIGEPLPGKVAHRALPDITVAQGNHSVSWGGRLLRTEPVAISILHFPVRSKEQFVNKITKGGAAYARNQSLENHIGSTWRKLFARHQNGGLETEFDRLAPTESEIMDGIINADLQYDFRLKFVLQKLMKSA